MSSRLKSTAIVREKPRREPQLPQTRSSFSGLPARVKSVGAFVPKLTEKAFSKYGFSAVALISEWPRIIGPALAAHTSPERLKWPRPIGKYTELEDGCEGRPGATLTLRVDPAKALDVQYGQAQVIERINGYFGYRAVEKIRIIQAPIQHSKPGSMSLTTPTIHALSETTLPQPAAAPPATTPRLQTAPPEVKDSALQAALDRLQQSIQSEKTENS